jgi:16S rRNA processing protein RimM
LSEKGSAIRRVEIGVVGRPHGIRGALHVFLHNPASSILEEIDHVLVALAGADPEELGIAEARRAGKGNVVVFAGVGSREQAERLTGARLSVPREALPPLDEGEYYVDDLMGLEVREGGRSIGHVAGSRAQGGIEVLTVRADAHDVDMPLVADYIVEIDLAGRRIEARGTDDLPRSARAPGSDSGA